MIATERLLLRPWRDEDGPEFVRVTNTLAVMAYLGGVRVPYDGEALAAAQQSLQAAHGFCFWIVERKADRALLGFCGLEPDEVGPFTAQDVEIGWRLREGAWGQGYAREAADACLAWAWANLAVPSVHAMTVAANVRSWRLMERIGMTRRADLNFNHPLFATDHPLSRHIVYLAERPVAR